MRLYVYIHKANPIFRHPFFLHTTQPHLSNKHTRINEKCRAGLPLKSGKRWVSFI